MKNKTIGILILLGTFAIIGLGAVQFYLLRAAFNNRQKVFEHTVQLALFQVVHRLNNLDKTQLPQKSPVIKESADYYVVEINKDFKCEVLEFYLISEFEKAKLNFDFEYAIYDCNSDQMIYGNYIAYDRKRFESAKPLEFPKQDDLTYYFAVHFPNIKAEMFGDLKIWLVFALIFISVLVFIVYALWLIVGQKRFSELQRNFVTTVSHEFRTPISASSVAIEYLQDSGIINKDVRLKKYIDLIQLQNTRLNNLIDRLLHITKSQSTAILKNEKINLVELVLDVVRVHEAKSLDAKIICDFFKENVTVCADRFHSINTLHVIIDNAIKYSGKQAIVTISIALERGYVNLRVSDNGIGIPEKYRKKIFRQFYRIPTGNVHNVKGFGIGLYYVKLITKKMKWKVQIEENKNGGATFLICIREIKNSCL